MITKVTVTNVRGTELEMLLSGDNIAPFQIRNITGLGPVSATVNTLPLATHDGVSVTGSSVGKRNIVFTLGLVPDWADQTMAGLRNALYAYLMPKQPVTLEIESSHLPTVTIAGIVESCEPNIFSKDPEIMVSILCPSPDFIALTSTVVTGVTLAGVAMAPDPDDYTAVNYVGTSPTGFTMLITDSVLVPEYLEAPFTINNVIESPGLNYEESIAFESVIDAVTFVEFSSVTGDRHIRRVTGGVPTSLLHTVSFYPGETWPQLIFGENQISVVADEEGLDWSMEYFARFGAL